MGLLEAHKAFAGKTAVVVGGCGEIVGRAVTLGLAREGVHIAACDIHEDAVAAIVPEVEALGVRMVAHHADAGDEAQLDGFYDRVEAEFGQVDIVVNVAAKLQRADFMETTRQHHADDIRYNYGYIVQSVQRAVPLLRKTGRGGSIVNFTTIEAHRGAATFAVYAGAKAATTNFSRAVAVELGREQIRVNCLAPDTSPAKASNGSLRPIDYERLAQVAPDAMVQSTEFYVPQQRQTTVEEVVDGVLFLASDLSRAITGTTLHVDGGTIASLGWIDWPGGDGYMPAPLGGTLAMLQGKGG